MSTIKKICPKCGGITSFNADADAAICEKCNAPFITSQAIEIPQDGLVDAKCTNCGAALKVNPNLDAAICEYCGSAFIVEKAINNFNVTINNITNNNIVADVVNIENHNYANSKVVNEVSRVYRIEKERTIDQFKKDVLLLLSRDINTPIDVKNINITSVEEDKIEAIYGSGQVNLSYTATIGFDREEQYQEIKEVWDKELQKNVQKTEIKTRTITDWHPHSGQRIEDESKFVQLDDKYGYVGVGLSMIGMSRESIVELDLKSLKATRVDDDIISSIKDGCISSASYSARSDLRGDHIKNFNYSGSCDIQELAYYSFPYYFMKYTYDGKEYTIGSIPSGRLNYNKEDTPKGESSNIEQKAKAETKKYKTVETTMWILFSIICALTLIIGIACNAYWIGFLVVIPLVLASVFMKIKIDKYNDIVENSFKYKLNVLKENLQQALKNNQLDELTSEEEDLFSVQNNKGNQEELNNKKMEIKPWKTATIVTTIIGVIMYIVAICGTVAN